MNDSATKPTFLKIYLKTLFLIVFFFIVLIVAYIVMNNQRLMPAPEQLVVYGRDSCGHTSLLRELLDDTAIDYTYANIDKGFIELEMWVKLGWLSGDVVSAKLPVIEYQNNIIERPHVGDLLAQLTKKHGTTPKNDD